MLVMVITINWLSFCKSPQKKSTLHQRSIQMCKRIKSCKESNSNNKSTAEAEKNEHTSDFRSFSERYRWFDVVDSMAHSRYVRGSLLTWAICFVLFSSLFTQTYFFCIRYPFVSASLPFRHMWMCVWAWAYLCIIFSCSTWTHAAVAR